MSQSAPQKRRRAVVACNSCRHRKSRCDGGRPCAQCKELECECVYQDVGMSNNLTVEKSYLARLENRIQDIEASLHRLENKQSTVQAASVASEPASSANPPVEQVDLPGHNPIPPVLPSTVLAHARAEYGEIDASENSIDGMGAINFTDEEDCGFFGPSSNIAFMRHISRAIARGNSHSPNAGSGTSPSVTGGGMLNFSRLRPPRGGSERQQWTSNNGINIFALPSEERTWDLIQIYFEKTGQLLPFIHEASFCETYHRMRADNFKKVRRTWLGLLNIVLAIATSLHVESDLPTGKRIEESDIYYQRANGLCEKDSKRNASLEMVQYLLVLGQYLQGTQKSVQAWTTHGLAISAAFQLGLHSPEANRRFSPIESEIRKRTWFGCILLDRTLSMTFGRPCTIPESYVKLDMPLTDMQVLTSTPQSESYSQLDGWFFTAAIKLYVVMFNILDNCYDQNLCFSQSLTTADIITHIVEGERQLEEWRFRVVPPLGIKLWHEPVLADNLSQMDPSSTISHRFGIVLSVRYHNLRILLYRKFLEYFLDNFGENECHPSGNSLLQQMGFTGIQNCIESAQSIISTVNTITLAGGWHRALLGAWNYTLYYTFNAGLVIFASLLVFSKTSLHNPEQWRLVDPSRSYLDLAAETLRRLDSGNQVIERCVEYLSQLSLILKSTLLVEPTGPRSDMSPQPKAYAPDIGPHNEESHVLWPDVDLGEFMVDNDLDFLGRMFNSSHPHNPGV